MSIELTNQSSVLDFTGVWKTRSGNVVEIESGDIKHTNFPWVGFYKKPGSQMTIMYDDLGDAKIEGKDWDLVERVSGRAGKMK